MDRLSGWFTGFRNSPGREALDGLSRYWHDASSPIRMSSCCLRLFELRCDPNQASNFEIDWPIEEDIEQIKINLRTSRNTFFGNLEMGAVLELQETRIQMIKSYLNTEFHGPAADLMAGRIEAIGGVEVREELSSIMSRRGGSWHFFPQHHPNLIALTDLLRRSVARDHADEILAADPIIEGLVSRYTEPGVASHPRTPD